MTGKVKIFLIVLILSLPFWWGVNVFEKNLEDFLFWQEIANNPQILTAQIVQEEKLESLKPIRDWQVEDLKIEAESAISVLSTRTGRVEKVLFEKASDKKLPIASLTKLMTAEVVLENYDLSQIVEISKEAVKEEGEFGNLKIGEVFTVKDLLYPLLMESSNGAAIALAEVIGQKGFVGLMNLEAKNLGLDNTYFANPTGLDKNEGGSISYSTTEDLVKLTEYLLKNQPLIWEILSTSEFDLYSLANNQPTTSEGLGFAPRIFHHKVINTNELLGVIPSVIGGKTGETPRAGGCLLLAMEAPKSKGYLINVVLNSGDRFGEMKKLINWLNLAYKW